MSQNLNPELVSELVKMLIYGSISFLLAMWWSPVLIKFLNWAKFWKKSSRKVSTTDEEFQVVKQFYIENEENKKIPRAGGLLISITSISLALFFWFILKIEENQTTLFLNFISRQETFIPIGTLFFASIFGFVDDLLVTMENGGNYMAGGLKLSQRLILVVVLSLAIGAWFYLKLDRTFVDLPSISFQNGMLSFPEFRLDFADFTLPFLNINLGWLIIPFVIFVLTASWGGSIIDGFDGLAAGVLIPVYVCFAGLSFVGGYYDIATFLLVIVGAMAAYLWYNIPPAQFYMGDTGSIGLLITLGVVSLLINKVYVLPIAGFVLLITEFSDIIQIFSKKVFKKKVFLAAPIHHHFEAKGWLRHQVTMRYWLVSIIASLIGFIVGMIVN